MSILGKITHEPLQQYVGLKRINAAPLTENNWLDANGRDTDPEDDTKGYVIQYEDGYVSWSPAHVFEESYKRSGEMSYPMALFMLLTQQQAKSVVIKRPIYTARNEVIVLVSGAALAYGINNFYGDPNNEPNPSTDGFFTFNIQTGKTAPWFPTQEDQLANDWEVGYFNVAGAKNDAGEIDAIVTHPAAISDDWDEDKSL